MTKTSWSIIRDSLVEGTKPGTFGRQSKLIVASDLFVRLLGNLKDQEESFAEWKIEPDLAEALVSRSTHQALKETGVIRGGV
jgi:hypothetical protein